MRFTEDDEPGKGKDISQFFNLIVALSHKRFSLQCVMWAKQTLGENEHNEASDVERQTCRESL